MADNEVILRISGDPEGGVRAAEAVRTALRGIGVDAKVVAGQANQAGAEFAKAFNRLPESLTRVGTAMTAGVTAPLTALIGGSVKAAVSFESAFANVRKTIGEVSKDVQTNQRFFDNLSGSIRKMATEIPQSVEQLSKIAALGGQFGISARGIEGFTRTIADLGVAVDGLETETAAEGLAQIRNITRESEPDISRMASALVHLGNNGASSEGQILELTKRIAGAGKEVGLRTPEIFGFAAAIANVGINAESGGTAFSRTLTQMSAAVDTGGEKLEAFTKIAAAGNSQLIQSSEDFKRVFQTNTAAAVEAFIQGLKNSKDAGENLTLLMKEFGAEGVRQADTLRRLGGAASDVGVQLRLSDEAWIANNKHTKEAEEKYKTVENQLKLTWQQIKDVGIELGNAFLPTIRTLISDARPLIDVLGSIARGFADMPEPVRAAFLALGVAGAGTGPLLILTGQAIGAAREVRSLATALKGLAVAEGAAGAVAGLGGSLGTLATAIGRVRGLLPAAGLAGLFVVSAAGAFTVANRGIDEQRLALDRWTAQALVTEAAAKALGRAPRDFTEAWATAKAEFSTLATVAETAGVKLTDAQINVKRALDQTNPFFDQQAAAAAVAAAQHNILSQEARASGDRMKGFGIILEETTTATKRHEEAVKGGVAMLAEAKAQVAALTTAQREEIKAWIELGLENDKVAAKVGVSEAVIKLFKESLKDSGAAAKQAAKDYKEVTRELEQLGLITERGVTDKINDLNETILAANQAGVPMRVIVRAIWQELVDLEAKAKASGISLKALHGYMADIAEAGEFVIKGTRGFDSMRVTVPTVTSDMSGLARATREANQAQDNLRNAFHAFGLQTPGELQKVALEAQRNYQLLKASGTATVAQLKQAHDEMIEAWRAATGQIPSVWESVVVPRMKDILGNLRGEFAHTFAEMLTGQASFREGFVGIWESIKRSVTDILASILDYFLNSFITGVLNALAGSQGGWGQAFANAFSGGGGGGGFNWGGMGTGAGGGTNYTGTIYEQGARWALGAMGLGGATATAVPGITATTGAVTAGVPTVGVVGAAGAGTGAGAAGAGSAGAGAAGTGGGTFGGLTVGGALGGAAAGGAGLGLGLLGTQIFGGSGWKASGFGAASGAGAGALIGTYVFPGVGTAIGAGIGALAGAIGGWIGKSVGEKVNDARDDFFKQFGEAGTGEGSAFANLSGDLAKLQGRDGRKMFTDLLQADSFDELNAAVTQIVDALESTEFATIKVREGFDALTQERDRLIAQGHEENAILEQQAGSYSLLFDTIKKTGATVPEAMIPILQKLAEMGLLVDEAGNKVTDLSAIAFAQLQNSVSGVGEAGADAFEQINAQIDAFIEKGLLTQDQADELRAQFEKVGEEGTEAIEGTTEGLDDLAQQGIVSTEAAEKLRQELLQQAQAREVVDRTTGAFDSLGGAIADATEDTHGLGNAIWGLTRDMPDWDLIRDQINEVGDAVDRVSFGQSPGGLKEIAPMLRAAEREVEEFSRLSVGRLSDLQRVVDGFGWVGRPGEPGARYVGTGGASGDTFNLYGDINASAIDASGLRELVEADDGIGPLLLQAWRRNARGMQTAAREILGI